MELLLQVFVVNLDYKVLWAKKVHRGFKEFLEVKEKPDLKVFKENLD